MGIPLYKPKECKEENQIKSIRHIRGDNDEFRPLLTQQFVQSTHHSRANNRRSSTRPTISNYHISPISSSSPIHHNRNNNNNDTNSNNNNHHHSRIRPRLWRRHSMLTSSLMDRRRSSRVHSIHGSSLTSTSSSHSSTSSSPTRSELDRRLSRRITEKEELLEQLRVTVSLLDQFILARETLGDDMMPLPAYLTEDLPAVLASASSLAAMTPSLLSSASTSSDSTDNSNYEFFSVQQLVDRFIRMPPYSTRVFHIENSIVRAHRRIREQLCLLGAEVTFPSPPSPQLLTTANDSITIEQIFRGNTRLNINNNNESEHITDFS